VPHTKNNDIMATGLDQIQRICKPFTNLRHVLWDLPRTTKPTKLTPLKWLFGPTANALVAQIRPISRECLDYLQHGESSGS